MSADSDGVEWVATGVEHDIAVRVTARDGELHVKMWDTTRLDPFDREPFSSRLIRLDNATPSVECQRALAHLREVVAGTAAAEAAVEEFVGTLAWMVQPW